MIGIFALPSVIYRALVPPTVTRPIPFQQPCHPEEEIILCNRSFDETSISPVEDKLTTVVYDVATPTGHESGVFLSVFVDKDTVHIGRVHLDPQDSDWRRRCRIVHRVYRAEGSPSAIVIGDMMARFAMEHLTEEESLDVGLIVRSGVPMPDIEKLRRTMVEGRPSVRLVAVTNDAVGTWLCGMHDRRGECSLGIVVNDHYVHASYAVEGKVVTVDWGNGQVSDDDDGLGGRSVTGDHMAHTLRAMMLNKVEEGTLFVQCPHARRLVEDSPISARLLSSLLTEHELGKTTHIEGWMEKGGLTDATADDKSEMCTWLVHRSARCLAAVIASHVEKMNDRSVVIALNAQGLPLTYTPYHELMMQQLAMLVRPGVQVSVVDTPHLERRAGGILAAMQN